MPVYTIASIAAVNAAIDAVGAVHGSYQALAILKNVLDEIAESDDLDKDLRHVESQQGPSYQGPDYTNRVVLKAAKTAARTPGDPGQAMLELLSLVITRLGTAQGARVFSMLILACGWDPALLVVVLKLGMILSRTEAGKRILAALSPALKERLVALAEQSELVDDARELLANLGQRGAGLLEALRATPNRVVQEADNLLNRLAPPESNESS